jgi:hypothetical protein
MPRQGLLCRNHAHATIEVAPYNSSPLLAHILVKEPGIHGYESDPQLGWVVPPLTGVEPELPT